MAGCAPGTGPSAVAHSGVEDDVGGFQVPNPRGW